MVHDRASTTLAEYLEGGVTYWRGGLGEYSC